MAKGIVIPIRIKQVGEAALKRMGKDFDSLSDKAKKNSKVFEGLNKNLKSASFAFGGTSTSIGGFTMGMGSIAKVSGTAALGLMVAVKAVKLLTDVMVAAVKTGSEFESTISNLQAQGGLSSEKIAELSLVIRELGASTKFTATEVAKGATELAKMGKSSEEIANMLPAITGFAAAVGTDFTTASTTAVNIMNQFGLEAENTQVLVDFMANSFRSSALDIGKFSTIMGYVGPIAASTGNSLEETATAAGLLADAGFKASKVGTGLRTIMLELGDAGSKASKLISEQAKAQGLAESTSLSLGEKLNVLKNSYVDATVATDIFGKRAAAQSLVLINAGVKYDELAKKISNYKNASQEMAATQLDNVAGAFTILKSASDNALLSLFDGFGPELQNIIEQVTHLVNNVTNSIQMAIARNQHWITGVGILAETFVRVVRTIITSINMVNGMWDFFVQNMQALWRMTLGEILDFAIKIWNKLPFVAKIDRLDGLDQYEKDVADSLDRMLSNATDVLQAMGFVEEDSLIARSDANGKYYDKAITDRVNFGTASLKLIKKNGELISSFQSQMNEDELTDLEKKQLTERTNLQVALKQQVADLTDHYAERLRIAEAAGDSGALQALKTQQARELKAIEEQNGRVLTAQTELHKKQGELDEKRRQRRERAAEKAVADWKKVRDAIMALELPTEGLFSDNAWERRFASISDKAKKGFKELEALKTELMKTGTGSADFKTLLDKFNAQLGSAAEIANKQWTGLWSDMSDEAKKTLDENIPNYLDNMIKGTLESMKKLEQMGKVFKDNFGDDPFYQLRVSVQKNVIAVQKEARELDNIRYFDAYEDIVIMSDFQRSLIDVERKYRDLKTESKDLFNIEAQRLAMANSDATVAMLNSQLIGYEKESAKIAEIEKQLEYKSELNKQEGRDNSDIVQTMERLADKKEKINELQSKGLKTMEETVNGAKIQVNTWNNSQIAMGIYNQRLEKSLAMEKERLYIAQQRAKTTFEIELAASDPTNLQAQLDKANNLVQQSYNQRTEFIMQNYENLDERQRLLEEAKAVREQESFMASANLYAQWGDTVAGYLNQAMALQSQLADAESKRIERRLSDEKDAIARSEKLGNISARTAAQREAKATETARAQQEELFNKQKQIAVAQALMNGAVAATKAFADYGWPIGAGIAALTTALTAGQVAVINSQQFATGGFPQGANANVTMNERGQESILNASATARLGRRAIEDLNAGRSVDLSTGNKVDTNASSSPTFIYSPSHTFNTSSQDTDIFAALEQDREKFSEFINDTRSRGYAL